MFKQRKDGVEVAFTGMDLDGEVDQWLTSLDSCVLDGFWAIKDPLELMLNGTMITHHAIRRVYPSNDARTAAQDGLKLL